jgi:hypothetical protein
MQANWSETKKLASKKQPMPTFFVLPEEFSFLLNFRNRSAKTQALIILVTAKKIFIFVTF